MAVTHNPIFTQLANVAMASFTTANTNRDGTGTIQDIFTAGANGSRVQRVRAKATGATTAGVLRLYIKESATYRLFKEFLVSAITPSATIESFELEYEPDPAINLETGQVLAMSTHIGEAFHATIEGADY